MRVSDSFRSYQGDGLLRLVEYGEADVIVANYRALPGDANGDLVVDISDFNLWNANKFTIGTDWTTGDFNGDGLTDISDFNVWNTNKFTSVIGNLRAVPEPDGLLPLLLVLGVYLGTRRRQCRLSLRRK